MVFKLVGNLEVPKMASDEAMKIFLKANVSSDLLYVFTDSAVPLKQQYDLGQEGCVAVPPAHEHTP